MKCAKCAQVFEIPQAGSPVSKPALAPVSAAIDDDGYQIAPDTPSENDGDVSDEENMKTAAFADRAFSDDVLASERFRGKSDGGLYGLPRHILLAGGTLAAASILCGCFIFGSWIFPSTPHPAGQTQVDNGSSASGERVPAIAPYFFGAPLDVGTLIWMGALLAIVAIWMIFGWFNPDVRF